MGETVQDRNLPAAGGWALGPDIDTGGFYGRSRAVPLLEDCHEVRERGL